MINLNSMLINVIQVGNHVIAGTRRRPTSMHCCMNVPRFPGISTRKFTMFCRMWKGISDGSG